MIVMLHLVRELQEGNHPIKKSFVFKRDKNVKKHTCLVFFWFSAVPGTTWMSEMAARKMHRE